MSVRMLSFPDNPSFSPSERKLITAETDVVKAKVHHKDDLVQHNRCICRPRKIKNSTADSTVASGLAWLVERLLRAQLDEATRGVRINRCTWATKAVCTLILSKFKFRLVRGRNSISTSTRVTTLASPSSFVPTLSLTVAHAVSTLSFPVRDPSLASNCSHRQVVLYRLGHSRSPPQIERLSAIQPIAFADMTFITSRDTVDALMGPAIRTQTSAHSVSPRQRRMLSAGMRSSSESNLVLSHEMTKALSNIPDACQTRLRPNQDMRRTSSSSSLSSPVSTSGYQPRRHRSRYAMYNSSIDLGSRSNLAPVMEWDLSPTEEKSMPINASVPLRTPRAKSLSPSSTIREPATASRKTAQEAIEINLSPYLAQNVSPSSARDDIVRLETMADTMTPKPDGGAKRKGHSLSKSLEQLTFDKDFASLSFPETLQSSFSSPELGCSCSFSSDGDDASRSSTSSISSTDEFVASRKPDGEAVSAADILNYEAMKQTRMYALYLAGNIQATPSPKPEKASWLLGPESPTLNHSFESLPLSTVQSSILNRTLSATSQDASVPRDAPLPSPVLKVLEKTKSGLRSGGMFARLHHHSDTMKSWSRSTLKKV